MKNKTLFLSMMIVLVVAGVWVALAADLSSVTLNTPQNNANITGTYVFNATTTGDAGNVTFYYNTSGGGWTEICSNATTGTQFTCSINTNVIPNATGYIVNATAYNQSGAGSNSTSTTSTGITFDNAAPTVSEITSPATNNTWKTSMTDIITINMTDAVDSTLDYNIFVNGTSNKTSTVTGGTATAITLTGFQDGVYYEIIAQATDDAGNSLNSSSKTLYYDATSPILNNPIPVDTGFIADATTTLFNITLTEQNIDSSINVTLYYKWSSAGAYSSNTLNCTGTAPTYYCNKTLDLDSIIGDGQTLNFFFNTTDLAGHTAVNGTQASPLTATVDETNPSKSEITSPSANDTWKTSMTNIITINMTDAVDSTLDYNIFVNGTSNKTSTVTGGTATAINLTGFQDGVYYEIIAQATDDAGNSLNSSSKTLYYDATAPSKSEITSPSANDTWKNSMTDIITINMTDAVDSTLDYNIFVNGTSNKTSTVTGGTATAIDLTGFQDGVYYEIIAQATDNSGNSLNSSSKTLHYDATAPSKSEITSPATNDTWKISMTDIITINMTDAVDSTLDYNIFVNGTSNKTSTVTGGTATAIDLTGFQDGVYYEIIAQATDDAGNSLNSSSKTLYYGGTAPVVNTLNNYGDNTWTTSTSVTFGFNATDTNADTCILYHNASTWGANETVSYTSNANTNFSAITLSDGHYLWNVLCNDSAGNSAWFGSNYTLKVDATSPILNNPTPADTGFIADATTTLFNITLTEQNIDSSINVTLYYKQSGAGAYSSDTLSCTGTAPTYYCSKTLDLDSIIGDGQTLNFFFNTTDLAGHTAINGTQANPLSATVDEISPVVNTLNNYGDNTWTTSNTITFGFNTTEAVSPDKCVLYHNASAWGANETVSYTSNANTNFNTITLSDGHYLWNVLCNDSAGNSAWFGSNYTLKVDATAPSKSEITSPSANDTWKNSMTDIITINMTDAVDSTLDYNIFVNGTSNKTATVTGGTATAINLTGFQDGVYYEIIAQATDDAGNSLNSSSKTLHYDATAPSKSEITSPSSNDTWKTSMTDIITINMTDAVDSTLDYNIFVNGTSNKTSTVTGGTATAITLTGFQDGVYYEIIAQATDDAGNSLNSSSKTLYYGGTAPVVNTLNNYGNNTWTTSTSITFGFNATNTNPDKCVLYHNASTWGANETVSYTSNANTNFSAITLSDGTHIIWNVLCNDSAGNSAWFGSNYTLKVDSTAPSKSEITSPATNDTWKTSMTDIITINMTDAVDSTLDYNIFVNGTSNKTSTVTGGTATVITLTGFQDGVYYEIIAQATDDAGNSLNSSSKTLYYGGTAPVVNTLNNYGNNTWTTSTSITFGFNATNTNPDKCVLYHNASAWGANETVSYTSNANTNFSAITLSDGTHIIWNVLCNDSAGNSAWFGSNYTLKVDSTAPSKSEITSPATNDTWKTSMTDIITINMTDAVDSTLDYNIFVNGTSNKTSTVTGGTATVITLTGFQDGVYYEIIAQATDDAGNSLNSSSKTLHYDATAPSKSEITSPATNDTWKTSMTDIITINMTDAVDSTLDYNIFVNGTSNKTATVTGGTATAINLTGFQDGVYYEIIAQATDDAGNSLNSSSKTLYYDATAPSKSEITSPATNDTWKTSMTDIITINMTDAVDSTLDYNIFVNGTSNKTSTVTGGTATAITLTGFQDGVYYEIIAQATDDAGNSLNSSSKTLYYDGTDPTITLNIPANYTWQTSNSITFNYTPTDTNIDVCILYHNASTWTSNTTNSSPTSGSEDIVVQTISDGIYVWNVWCNDSAGRSAWAEAINYSLRIDVTGPTATMDTLSTYSTETFAVSWSAIDTTSGVATYNVQINDDGGGWSNWYSSTTLTSANYAGANGHTYYFRVNATDYAGNTGSYSANESTTISTSAPTITFYDNSYGPYSSDPGNVINVTFSDTDDLDYAQYKIGANGTWTDIFASNYAGTSYTSLWGVSWAGLEEGTNTIYVRAYDDAGNVATPVETITYIKDTIGPTTTMGALASTQSTTTFTVEWSATDATSSISSYNVQYSTDNSTWIDWVTSVVYTSKQFPGSEGTTYYFRSNATDAASNTGSYSSVVYTEVVAADTTPPAQVTGLTALVWTGGANRNIMINWTANTESDLNYYIVYINDIAAGTTYLNEYTYATPYDGTWTVNVSAVDTSGNEGTPSTSVSITIDITAPIVVDSSPTGTVTNSTPDLYVTTDEDATCKYDTSDKSFANMATVMNGTGTTSHSADLGTLTDIQQHQYYVRCNDSNGNVMTYSTPISFILDTTGNFDYTQQLNKNWNTLWLGSTGIIETWGINVSDTSAMNISTFLSTTGNLGTNYNIVYYNTDGTDSGWKYFERGNWSLSNLKYVNNTNDKPYWINMSVADRFEVS